MLETSEERVKLLKAGFTGKAIEKLYIEGNNFKIVRIPPSIEFIEIGIPQNKEIFIECEEATGRIQSFCPEEALLCK